MKPDPSEDSQEEDDRLDRGKLLMGDIRGPAVWQVRTQEERKI